MENKDVLILAIESSCDETAAAVVKNGRTVLSSVINSQIDIHTLYGGVVPEIASRKHIENINPVIELALKQADVTLDDITAIGVTYGPGLVGVAVHIPKMLLSVHCLLVLQRRKLLHLQRKSRWLVYTILKAIFQQIISNILI